MTTRTKRSLNFMASAIIGILAFGCLVCCVFFAGALARRAYYAVAGWEYPFRAVGETLGLAGPYTKLLAWDSSFIFLGSALVLGTAAGVINDLTEWANKSPDQRHKERQAVDDVLQAQREKRREKKASRKQMSGWRRLWIVLSVLCAVPAFIWALEAFSDEADAVLRAFIWALMPALLMALVGLVLRWVYRGFRPARQSEPWSSPPPPN